MKKTTRRTLATGTSLIELLVVIVVFLIGILAIAQIFPGGFKILSRSRADSIATTLAHQEMDRIRSAQDQLPEQVVPVIYVQSGGYLIAQIQDFSEDDLGPQGASISQPGTPPPPWNALAPTWDVFDSSNNDVGPWQYVSGANKVRHVIGEGKTVTAPRPVGNLYGALMTLQFAPIVAPANGAAPATLLVYSNDMDRISGVPAVQLGQTIPSYQYYCNDSNPGAPVLFIPQDPNGQRTYKLSLAFYVNTLGGIFQESEVVSPIIVPAGSGYFSKTIDAPMLGLGGGQTLNSVAFDSLRLARLFEQVPVGPNNFNVAYNTDGTPQDPYQYELLDPSLGLILLNPLAYQYVERSASGRRVVLQARADYDVFDWRILKEDFRLPTDAPYEYQMKVGNIKHHNGYEPDNTLFQGINVLVPDETGTPGPNATERRDVIAVDQQTGYVISKSSFTVNYSLGLLTFVPKSTNNNTYQIGLVNPVTNTVSLVDAGGRAVRLYYMAVGEWATQLLKAPSSYIQVQVGTKLLPGEFFIAPVLNKTFVGVPPNNGDVKIRFPFADTGKTVTFDELWYVGSDSKTHVARGQSLSIQPDKSVNGGNPYISLTDLDPGAIGADYSNGYAVQGVKGVSVSVRVVNNPGFMTFSKTDSTGNINVFDEWERGWRHISTEAVIKRGSLQ